MDDSSSVKGSYTVEAAFIFPFVFFVIIGLIYLGFYMHDKVKMEAIIDQTLLKGKGLIRNEMDIRTGSMDYKTYYSRGIFDFTNNNLQEKQEEVYNYLKEELKYGLFLAKVENIEVTASNTNISIKVIAIMEVPFFSARKHFLHSGFNIEIENSSTIQEPMEFIRIFDVFSGVAGKFKEVDEAIIKLQSILRKIR